MRKILFLCMLTLTVMGMKANNAVTTSYDMDAQDLEVNSSQLVSLEPTYLKNVCEGAGWGSNWFVEAKGGVSAFIGKPVGCGDLFDRTTPVVQIGVGKWFTPAIGGRIAFQGLKFKNSDLGTMKYQLVHADFMWNVTANLGQNDIGLSRWDIIPFVGIGMAHNADWSSACCCDGHSSGNHPFAFDYGIELRYRLFNRLHVIAELSNMSTLRNFDTKGVSTRFGDNMLSLSAGLSVTLGKVGYKRVVDATPYRVQNEWLRDYAFSLDSCNRDLRQRLLMNEQALAEYQKILKMEGLLNKYGILLDEQGNPVNPKNNYSGLNSLRARLRAGSGEMEDGIASNPWGENTDSLSLWDGTNDADYQKYLIAIHHGSALGAPIYFLFRIGTDKLTDECQTINLDELAQLVNEYHLKVTVRGNADAATGTSELNKRLSQKRADFIEQQLLKRGVDASQITKIADGGITLYSPTRANRNTCVTISF